jgi:acetoacetyl-CoA synthetase
MRNCRTASTRDHRALRRSPFYPDGIDSLISPIAERDALGIDSSTGGTGLSSTRTRSTARITRDGSPPPELRLSTRIKRDVHRHYRGTDIVSCFVGGVPTEPVRGDCRPGSDGRAWMTRGGWCADGGRTGRTSPFPSMPVGFWNDADGAKYRAAYFERFPNVWCHGDWVTRTASGGLVIAGRSDATLNPGGVRIGTAEIYRQVERLPEVIESLAVGQQWDGDERVVLFVRLREGVELGDELRTRIAREIRANTSPRHVPARIVQVTDIPRTKSGKIVELAVRHVIHGRPVKNREALANPEALDLFLDLAELKN